VPYATPLSVAPYPSIGGFTRPPILSRLLALLAC
jgi:hypothetical protein